MTLSAPGPALRRRADGVVWSPVHRIVGPLAERTGTGALYADGAAFGASQPTGSGMRRTMIVPPFSTASFATYFNHFPAAYWRHWTAARRVRLRLVVDAEAVLVVHGSTADGTSGPLAVTRMEPFEPAELDFDLDAFADGGLLWFDLQGGETCVAVVEGSWDVDVPERRSGRLLLGMPTLDRPAFLAANLHRLLEAPDLLQAIEGFLVVDQGRTPAAADPRVAAPLARIPEARIVRQPNLGGSGGFSRVLLEAAASDAAFVTLLDDDIALEPESVLRAYGFGLRTTDPAIVGGQMLDLSNPTVLHSGAEVVDRRRFWWRPTAADQGRPDLGSEPLPSLPWAHRRLDADFAGWWMCQIPTSVIAGVGLALPLFLKWDDAEYGLRAAAAGVPTISLQGAAVWHVAWAEKDDMLEWPAWFHARNRLVGALLHDGGRRTVAASLLLDLKHLLSMQYSTVELRHHALAAVVAGPRELDRAPVDVDRVRRIVASAPDLVRHGPEAVPDAPDAAVTRSAPDRQPQGVRFLAWLLPAVGRHLLDARGGTAGTHVRLSGPRRRWWVLPAHDSVLSPTADRSAFFWYRRDASRFRAGLARSARMHWRLLRDWTDLRAEWRAAAPELAAASSWARRFADAADREA